MNWYNIRGEIAKNKLLQPGEVLTGSAFFLLPISNPKNLEKINNFSIIVVDYLGNKTKNPINLERNSTVGKLTILNEPFEDVPE